MVDISKRTVVDVLSLIHTQWVQQVVGREVRKHLCGKGSSNKKHIRPIGVCTDPYSRLGILTRSGAMSLIGKGWSGWAGHTMGCDLRTATMQVSIMKPNLEERVRSSSSSNGFFSGKSGVSTEERINVGMRYVHSHDLMRLSTRLL